MTRRVQARLRSAAPWCLIALIVLLAWHLRFIQDDAFISFRYAQNLVDGHGLVFNPGEPVEGYTNFLWTALIASGIWLGFDPITFSHSFSMLFFLCSSALLYSLGRVLLKSDSWACLPLVLAGTNYSFLSYATGGLETSLQTCLVLAAAVIAVRTMRGESVQPLSAATLSVVCALNLMTRLDSCLLAGPLMLGVLLHIAGLPDRKKRTAAVTAALLPALVMVGTWFGWKLWFYGSILPNAFYAKTAGSLVPTLTQGSFFVFEFARSYWMVPQLLLCVLAIPAAWMDRGMRWICVSFIVWIVYVVDVGGDFMEFRLMVPLIPFMMILFAWTVKNLASAFVVRIVLVAVTVLGSIHHAQTFSYARGIESISNLEGHLTRQFWTDAGKKLGEIFNGEGSDTNTVLAVSPAGAIPYYSGLVSIDMLGLTDSFVARNGIHLKTQPGHELLAPYGYLLARRVNLVVAHPIIIPRGYALAREGSWDLEKFKIADAKRTDLPSDSLFVELPVNDTHKLLLLYLVRDDRIDEAVRKHGLVTWPARRTGTGEAS